MMEKKRQKRPDYSKMSMDERKQKVEQLYVKYPRHEEVIHQFAYCHNHSKIAAEPEGLLLEGPAGMGKDDPTEALHAKLPLTGD